MGKGQILNQKCRDVVRVPEVEVRVAEIFEGVGESGFGGDEIKSLRGWELLCAVFGGCPLLFFQ